MRLTIIRHGQSEANVDKDVYFRKPTSQVVLTSKGEKQASLLGSLLYNVDPDKTLFITSPYIRTVHTMQNMLEAGDLSEVDVDVWADPLIVEQCWGQPMISKDDFFKALEHHKEDPFFFRFPYGESMFDVYSRIRLFDHTVLEQMSREHYDNVFIISHGITIKVLVGHLKGLSINQIPKEDHLYNCEFFTCDWNGREASNWDRKLLDGIKGTTNNGI